QGAPLVEDVVVLEHRGHFLEREPLGVARAGDAAAELTKPGLEQGGCVRTHRTSRGLPKDLTPMAILNPPRLAPLVGAADAPASHGQSPPRRAEWFRLSHSATAWRTSSVMTVPSRAAALDSLSCSITGRAIVVTLMSSRDSARRGPPPKRV